MKFEKLLDRATSKDLLEPDWDTMLTVVDAVRSGEVHIRSALAAVQKKIHSENPHVAHHALLLLESLVKNCGEKVHVEVASKEFMEDMKHVVTSSSDKVKEKILELIQVWAHAFKDKPEYKIVKDTMELMKMEGYQFPQLIESSAMFDSESAPEWVDADSCYRCKIAFGLLTRKHHCRSCGQIFCDRCSSRTSVIPKYGIEREVRVCETCYGDLRSGKKGSDAGINQSTGDGKSSDSATDETKLKVKKEEDAQREEEELQLALALSQSEAEEKQRQKRRVGYYTPYNTGGITSTKEDNVYANGIGYTGTMETSSSSLSSGLGKPSDSTDLPEADGELARYLNRDYWEQKQKDAQQQKTPGKGGSSSAKGSGGGGILRSSPTPSAPMADPKEDQQMANGPHMPTLAKSPLGGADGDNIGRQNEALQNGEPDDGSEFVSSLQANIEVFVNRIRSNQARGRSVLNDSSLQSLFLTLTSQHSDLLKHLEELDNRRGYFEGLQDKLAQIKDAREAVISLRAEHEDQRRRELMEQQRVRQIQMMQKLEVMRQKKHEYLEHQRLLAIQQMQQQEHDMAMRKQQQAYQLAARYIQSPPPIGPTGVPQWPNTAVASAQGGAYNMQSMTGSLPQVPTATHQHMPGLPQDAAAVQAHHYNNGGQMVMASGASMHQPHFSAGYGVGVAQPPVAGNANIPTNPAYPAGMPQVMPQAGGTGVVYQQQPVHGHVPQGYPQHMVTTRAAVAGQHQYPTPEQIAAAANAGSNVAAGLQNVPYVAAATGMTAQQLQQHQLNHVNANHPGAPNPAMVVSGMPPQPQAMAQPQAGGPQQAGVPQQMGVPPQTGVPQQVPVPQHTGVAQQTGVPQQQYQPAAAPQSTAGAGTPVSPEPLISFD